MHEKTSRGISTVARENMNEENHDIRLIEKAILNSLSPEEQREFVHKMEDKSFETEYKIRSIIHQKISEKGRAQWKEKLTAIEDKYSKPNPSRKRYGWAIAATILLCVGIFGIITLRQNTNDKLFATYYQTLPNLVDPISKSEGSEFSAFQLYERKQFLEAIDQFNQIRHRPDAQFYLALSYLELDRYTQAQNILLDVSQNPDHPFEEEAQWYLTLSFLKDDNEAQLNQWLNTILSNPNHFYHSKAKELRDKI